jgi:hypothetical protein
LCTKLIGKNSCIVNQQSSFFGHLNVDITDKGQVLTAKFIQNNGKVFDSFSITKWQIQQIKFFAISNLNPPSITIQDNNWLNYFSFLIHIIKIVGNNEIPAAVKKIKS